MDRRSMTLPQPSAPSTTGSSQRTPGWLLLTAAAVGLTLLALGAPLCPFAGWLGIPCPGCGLTRATVALMSGDWHTALRWHPMVGFVLPMLAWFAMSALLTSRQQAPGVALARVQRLGNWCGLALVIALIAVWGLRFAGFFGGPVPVKTYAAWWNEGRITR